jgi:transcriptional regulator with XRE-family HTH domain
MADRFDTAAFFSALNAVRAKRNLTWKEVARQSEINPSTLSRIGQGKNPDVNGFLALLSWSGLKAEMFTPDSVEQIFEPIANIALIIRKDKALSQSNAKLMEEIVSNAYKTLRHR